jgi:hypothetical protein
MEPSLSIHNLDITSMSEFTRNLAYKPPITATVSTFAPTGAVLDVAVVSSNILDIGSE